MFGKVKDFMGQMQLMQKMMQDENFKAFISHPKIQVLMKDPEFIELLKSKDIQKISGNPKFSILRDDRELADLAQKMAASISKYQ